VGGESSGGQASRWELVGGVGRRLVGRLAGKPLARWEHVEPVGGRSGGMTEAGK